MVFLLKNYFKTDFKSFSEGFYIAGRGRCGPWQVRGMHREQVLDSVLFRGVMLLGKPAPPSDEGSVTYLVGFPRSMLPPE